MPYPRLLHQVNCILKIGNRSATLMDADTREPVQTLVYRGEITVPGQPRESIRKRDVDVERGGRNERESGYVLFRVIDLDEKLKAIGSSFEEWSNSVNGGVNDRIITLGNQKLNGYITRLEPMGHYPQYGGATLVKAFFTDRAPARKSGGA